MLYAPHTGARVMTVVFPVLGLIVLLVGGISSHTYPGYLQVHFGTATTKCVYLGVAMAFATIVFASMLIFCGYVIDLLVQNELDNRETALNVSADDVPAPPKRYV